MPYRERASDGRRATREVLVSLVTLPFLTAGCGGGSSSNSNVTRFRPGIAVILHAVFDPSSPDKIARHASYSAWVELENDHTLDLAVRQSEAAARHALRQYQAGAPETRPTVDDPAWGTAVRRVERIRNVTLAWYHLPRSADEKAVKRSLQFRARTRPGGDYTTLWVMPGTYVDPDATAATAPAR
jgi:hypothetical protein